ncbi:type VII secretion protein EccE [Nocardia mangyaensis]|uniref:Type VII secretion protein EccE n=1 Tax=Nocardia mangyaensis TaxID=2213200 RepID=A0A1J0VMN6_9NOCA|nr:type VII secretion protein EccE [Nocardia mangyaensis]
MICAARSGWTKVNEWRSEIGASVNSIENQQESVRESATSSTDRVLRDPEFWLFRWLPLRWVLPTLLLAAVIAWCVTAAGAHPVVAPILAALTTLALLTPWRRGEPRSAAAWLARELGFRWRRSDDRLGGNSEPFDVALPEGGSYGMRWDDDRLITVLRIDPPPDALTLLRRGALTTDQMLPLTEIAGCLEQFDITLASIDVISTGSRTAGDSPVARIYDQIVGPLPAIADRTVWLVLRLDPLANAEAVDSRGGGTTGVLRSALIATRRVANRLAARDITVSVLTAGEINSATRQLTHGLALEEFEETPRSLVGHGMHLTSYEVGADLIGPRGFAAIWATPALATTLTLRLRGHLGPRTRPGAESGAIVLDAVVRFDTATAPGEPPLPGLRQLTGRQLPTLLDSVPIDARTRRVDNGQRGPRAALTEIVVPTAGCGQLIGADDAGQGLAVPLVGDGTRHLEVVGKLDLAQQVLLRAIALGARVIVHTDRPEAWHSMVANLNTPHLLSLAPRYSGTGNPAPTAPPPGLRRPLSTVIVYDGITPAAPSGGATVVHVRSPDQQGGYVAADVVLEQDDTSPNAITVRTATATATVRMVTTPEEMRYIGESLAAAR